MRHKGLTDAMRECRPLDGGHLSWQLQRVHVDAIEHILAKRHDGALDADVVGQAVVQHVVGVTFVVDGR